MANVAFGMAFSTKGLAGHAEEENPGVKNKVTGRAKDGDPG